MTLPTKGNSLPLAVEGTIPWTGKFSGRKSTGVSHQYGL